MNDFTVNELVRCARREVAYRKRVYPRLVEQGTLEAKEAEREIALMSAIAELLESKVQPKLL